MRETLQVLCYYIVTLATLKYLTLPRCEGADSFLANLSRSKDPPQLHALRVNHRRPATHDTIVTAIDDFLFCTPSSLHTLTILLRGYDVQPNASSIAHHGSTLKRLSLDVRRLTDRILDNYNNESAVVYSDFEAQELFVNLPNLT